MPDQMKLLRRIQSSLLDGQADLGTVLLMVRVLAARLGSKDLGDWVEYETEGYPEGVRLPSYRIVPTSYTGTFHGPMGSGIENARIAPALVAKHASKSWTHQEIRQGIAAVTALARPDRGGDAHTFDASDLVLLLQGKVYPMLSCTSVTGYISKAVLEQIEYMVRKRVLDFTLALERSVPSAAETGVAPSSAASKTDEVAQTVAQVLYGDFVEA